MSMSLSTVGSTNWIHLPVANITGNPHGLALPLQTAFVKFDAHYSPNAHMTFFDVSIRVKDAAGKTLGYLTADESKITVNTVSVETSTTHPLTFVHNIITSQALTITLNFTNNAGTPDVNVTA